jgi:sorbitol-specific phosphotransferase system component IIBC
MVNRRRKEVLTKGAVIGAVIGVVIGLGAGAVEPLVAG